MTKVAKGILIAGIAIVVLAGVAIAALAGVAFLGWNAALRAGNEEAAFRHLQTIAAVEVQYHTHNRKFGTFAQLVEGKFLDNQFSGEKPVVDGYVFVMQIKPTTTTQPASFSVNADPQTSDSGTKHFYIDSSTSDVRVNSHQPAAANDPPHVK